MSNALNIDDVAGFKIRRVMTPVPVGRWPANFESVNGFDAVSLANLQLHLSAPHGDSLCAIRISETEGVAQDVVAMDRIDGGLALPTLAG